MPSTLELFVHGDGDQKLDSTLPQVSSNSSSCASPHPRRPLRTPSLPTPSPSPSASSTSTDMNSPFPADSLDPVLRRMQHLSFTTSSFGPTPPHSPLPFTKSHQQSFPSQYETPTSNHDSPAAFGVDFDLDSDQAPTYPRTGSNFTSGRVSYEAFKQTKSRVVRVFNLPSSSSATAQALARLFYPAGPQINSSTHHSWPTPVRMWTLREDCGGQRAGEEDSVWVVFKTHEEACNALHLSGTTFSIATALEGDLEPFSKLRKFELRNVSSPLGSAPPQDIYRGAYNLPPSPPSSGSIAFTGRRSDSASGPQHSYDRNGGPSGYQLSSNPPNPRSIFRLGDWICASPNCAAHNFGRNIACIGCGCPRSMNGPSSPPMSASNTSAHCSTRSPRFAGNPSPYHPSSSNPAPTYALGPSSPPNYNLPINIRPQTSLPYPPTQIAVKPPPPSHPLLTPSGRALAIGGKVQNVSSDPLAPCIIYWPENEPFPEQGQIRPGGLVTSQQPPILNTGNRGPIEHQPGDWVCHKCEYLNWRRRKVCQTCFPYAEGNGDSVSAVVQAERIALLTSVLVRTQSPLTPQGQQISQTPSSRSFYAASDPQPPATFAQQYAPVPWSHPSHVEASSYRANLTPAPRISPLSRNESCNIVYQTPTPASAMNNTPNSANQSGPLLPSFLKNEITTTRSRTPSSMSPASSSSADLSFDEYDDDLPSPVSLGSKSGFYAQPLAGSGTLSNSSGSTSSSALASGNIWALNRDENKSWGPVALPNPDDLVGSRSRTSSREVLRPMLVGR